VRTLTLEEAATGLGKWLKLAIAGEDIRIREGDALVELRPVAEHHKAERRERLAAREALRQLQSHARLTSNEAQDFLKELREERLAADMRRPA
jgi:hypothetical protein